MQIRHFHSAHLKSVEPGIEQLNWNEAIIAYCKYVLNNDKTNVYLITNRASAKKTKVDRRFVLHLVVQKFCVSGRVSRVQYCCYYFGLFVGLVRCRSRLVSMLALVKVVGQFIVRIGVFSPQPITSTANGTIYKWSIPELYVLLWVYATRNKDIFCSKTISKPIKASKHNNRENEKQKSCNTNAGMNKIEAETTKGNIKS